MTAETPLYRVTAPTYLDGAFYTPESQPADGLPWSGEPNAAMEPINDAATLRVKARGEHVKKALVRRPLISGTTDLVATAKRADDAEARAALLEAELAAVRSELAALKLGAVDDLADVRTMPGDSAEKLEAIEREVDEANGKLSPAQVAALDHDGDGKAGGSKPRAKRSPEEAADRKAAIAILREKGVSFFAGATTEALMAQAAEA